MLKLTHFTAFGKGFVDRHASMGLRTMGKHATKAIIGVYHRILLRASCVVEALLLADSFYDDSKVASQTIVQIASNLIDGRKWSSDIHKHDEIDLWHGDVRLKISAFHLHARPHGGPFWIDKMKRPRATTSENNGLERIRRSTFVSTYADGLILFWLFPLKSQRTKRTSEPASQRRTLIRRMQSSWSPPDCVRSQQAASLAAPPAYQCRRLISTEKNEARCRVRENIFSTLSDGIKNIFYF